MESIVPQAGSARNATAAKVVGHTEAPTSRLDVPRAGYVLSTRVETYACALREAVSILSGSLAQEPQCAPCHRSIFARRTFETKPEGIRPAAEMAAWALVAMRTCAIASRAHPATVSLPDAERWFLGPDAASERLTDLVSKSALARTEVSLASKNDRTAYLELLPYMLDPDGPADRLTVRRNPQAEATRARRRAQGVFYTPADVAEAMVEACLKAVDGDEDARIPTVFDPACGTGVFLRAALKELRRRQPATPAATMASEALFGADIDPWAIDAAAFVLMTDVWSEEQPTEFTPVALWRNIRRNLACIDALRIDPSALNNGHATEDSFAQPGAGAPEGVGGTKRSRIPLPSLFPALTRAPQVIVGNPPYAIVGERDDYSSLQRVFKAFARTPERSAQIYLAFLEQMLRLACKDICTGALVLPLSLACNVGAQYSTARRLIAQTPGHWRFAFFDREPHALFGEGVKTRNAVALWRRTSSDSQATIATGPLRKWRGDSRATMLRSLRFTEIDCDIAGGIPKIDGARQAKALKTLCERWTRLDQAVHAIGRVPLADAPNADDRTVFVGPTAYNFLNVFMRPPGSVLSTGPRLSEHPLFAIECVSSDDALAVFSALASRLAYWWWHAHGDGFHVSKRFIESLPFGMDLVTGKTGAGLAATGKELWSKVRTHPIITANRGRTSLAYTPNGHDGLRRQADQALADVAGLESGFVDELQRFTAHTVAATLRGAPNDHVNERGAT